MVRGGERWRLNYSSCGPYCIASLPLSEYSRVKEERISVGLPQSEVGREVEPDLESVTSRQGETLEMPVLRWSRHYRQMDRIIH